MGNIDFCSCSALDADEFETESKIDNSRNEYEWESEDEEYQNASLHARRSYLERKRQKFSMQHIFSLIITGFIRKQSSTSIILQNNFIKMNILRLIAIHLPSRIMYSKVYTIKDIVKNTITVNNQIQNDSNTIAIDFQYISKNRKYFQRLLKGKKNDGNDGMLNLCHLNEVFFNYKSIAIYIESDAYTLLVNYDWWLQLLREIKQMRAHLKDEMNKKQDNNKQIYQRIYFYFINSLKKAQIVAIQEQYDLYHQERFTNAKLKCVFKETNNYLCVQVKHTPTDAMSLLVQFEMPDLLDREARFLRTLPSQSKQHIWSHSVKSRNSETRKKQIFDETQNKDHIERLMCDCTIVYIKYLDRSKVALMVRDVRPYVKDVAQFIFDHRHPLKQGKFIKEQGYLASCIEEYVEVLLCLVWFCVF